MSSIKIIDLSEYLLPLLYFTDLEKEKLLQNHLLIKMHFF